MQQIRGTGLSDDGHSDARRDALTRVSIAAPTRLYCDGLASLLSRRSELEVVGTATERRAVIAQVARLEPDVVLVDPMLDEGLETIHDLALVREVPVIAVGCLPDDRIGAACADAGASRFVEPRATVVDLLDAIRGACGGDLLFPPGLDGGLGGMTAVADGRAANLTARELQVVRLIDEGLSNKEIALELEIGLSTVKHHVHHILEKLEVARRSEAVARLRQNGVLQH